MLNHVDHTHIAPALDEFREIIEKFLLEFDRVCTHIHTHINRGICKILNNPAAVYPHIIMPTKHIY